MLNLKDDTGARRPRDDKGRIVTRACPDPNCGGDLAYETETVAGRVYGLWRCNGLTHSDHLDSPLEACRYTHRDGEPVAEH